MAAHGSVLAAGGSDGAVRLYACSERGVLRPTAGAPIAHGASAVLAVALAAAHASDASPSLVLSGGMDRVVRAWRTAPPHETPLYALGGHCGWSRAIAITPRLAVTVGCERVRVWSRERTAAPALLAELCVRSDDAAATRSADVLSLAALESAAPEGPVAPATVWAGGVDGRLHSWRLHARGRAARVEHSAARAHAGRVGALARVGDVLVSASHDGCARAWPATERGWHPSAPLRALCTFRAAAGSRVLSLAPAGPRRVLAGMSDGAVALLRVPQAAAHEPQAHAAWRPLRVWEAALGDGLPAAAVAAVVPTPLAADRWLVAACSRSATPVVAGQLGPSCD